MWDQLDATISDFIVNILFLNMFLVSLRPKNVEEQLINNKITNCCILLVSPLFTNQRCTVIRTQS